MSVYRVLMLFIAGCAFYADVLAQTNFSDTVFRMQEVHVYANLRDAHVIGATVQTIDTIALKRFNSRSISDLLSTSGVNIKSYGLGGLSSIVLRGGSSSHTTIVWNGLNIQNPMSGSTNLSLLPVNMFNSIKLQYGGSGTLCGSGAVTGVLRLSSGYSIAQPNKISASLGYGSGNTKVLSTSAKWGTQKFAFALKGYVNKADNDFEFINTTKINRDKERITNAQAGQMGVLGDVSLRLNSNCSWSVSGWYQYYDKNIQTLMSSSIPSIENQTDKNFLASSNFKWDLNGTVFSLKNGLINGTIDYANPRSGEFTHSRSVSAINELETKVRIKSHSEVIMGLNYTHELAKSGGYLNVAHRNRVALFSSYRLMVFDNRLNSVFSLRDEVIDGDIKPIIFSFGTDFNLNRSFKLKTSLSRNYRVPTLNDLYWAPSAYAEGNLNLKPEYGWSGEFGVEYASGSTRKGLVTSVTAFLTDIDDCITWFSDPDAMGKWKPYNIDNLKTYGVESRADLRFAVDRLLLNIGGFYTYTHSRIHGQDNYDGKPLVYVPVHKFNGNLQLLWNGFGLAYSHLFNGERYKDYTSTLPYFNIGDVSAEYTFNIRPSKISIRFTVNNVWNTNYQLVANYAMPMRNYMLTLSIDFM